MAVEGSSNLQIHCLAVLLHRAVHNRSFCSACSHAMASAGLIVSHCLSRQSKRCYSRSASIARCRSTRVIR